MSTTLTPAVVGSVVTPSPTFEVRAENGRALRANVAVAVTAGGGSIANAPTRSLRGPTEIGAWTLGNTAGPQSLSVSVDGIPTLTFTINALPAAASALNKVGNPDLRAPELSVVPTAIEVRLVDAFGNGVSGATVAWAVTAGGGSVGAASSVTNATGVATAPAWTLGADGSGAQTLVATSGAFNQSFSAVIQEPPASITIEQAAPASLAAGTSPVAAPTFAVRDAANNILNGIPVTITVTAGSGSLEDSPAVTDAGPTSIGTWTLDESVGTNSVTVSVAGVPSVVFTTEGVVGPVSKVTVVEGEGQEALAGTALAQPVRVLAADQFDNPSPGSQVFWTLISGDGSLAAAVSMTDGSGIATMPEWTLGKTETEQSVQVVAGSASRLITAAVQTNYDLEIRWRGTPPAGDVQAAFLNAAARIRAGVVGQLSTLTFTNFDANACVSGLTLNEAITGLVIYATVEPIDGVGSVLGSAGPCYIRTSNQLSAVGRMRFDVADLENLSSQGRLESVILHEMLHVIGVGTLWVTKGLRSGEAPGSTPFFTGALARDACINDHNGGVPCASAVPAEDCLNLTQSCGSGTINSHWKESVFQSELMTGYLSAGANPFSKMTLQSLADLGYTVNLNIQDAYTVPPPSLMSSIPAWSLKLPDPHTPLAALDAAGNVVRVYRTSLPDHE
ncbi:MAG: hypothetical protein KF709_05505 [Gemmatimonadaceae bacterium]|nr:hypothetical protein [Gemmatimonadaceae bacterium]